jgi:hypothetical protein
MKAGRGGLVGLRLAIGLLLAVFQCSTAHSADYFVEAGIGPSLLQKTTADGIWWQSPFPNYFDLSSVTWKAGLGVQLDPHWSLTASYVTLGTAKAVTEFVSDVDFQQGKYDAPRDYLTAYDNYQGGQLLGRYRWTHWPVQPFLQGGMAAMLHHVVANRVVEFSGILPMAVVGGGICYAWICGEVSYYRGLQAPAYPISTAAVVPMLSLKYPF